MAPSADLRIDGVLESWNDERGFGFLALPYGGKPVFVHIHAFERMPGRPRVGDRFSFVVEQAEGDTFQAAHVWSLKERPVRRARARTRPTRSPRPTSAAWLAPLGFVALYLALNAVWGIQFWVGIVYVGLSIVSFAQYATDKRAAQNRSWRISEQTLQVTSLLGGWPGSIAAQQLLRHKTRKREFLVVFWSAVVVNVAAFVAVALLT